MKLNEIIRAKRAESGLTLMKVGNAVGASNVSVSLWEQGKRIPTLPNRIKLAKVLGVDLQELIPELSQ